MLNKLKLKHLNKLIDNQRIFLRADLNVPIKNGKISNDFRIKSSLPSIEYIMKNNPRQFVLASHLGRPDGNVNPAFTLEPVFKYL